MIHEFLLVKGVEAVAIHGSKDQEEREWAIDHFKAGNKVGAGARAGGLVGHMRIQLRVICSPLQDGA